MARLATLVFFQVLLSMPFPRRCARSLRIVSQPVIMIASSSKSSSLSSSSHTTHCCDNTRHNAHIPRGTWAALQLGNDASNSNSDDNDDHSLASDTIATATKAESTAMGYGGTVAILERSSRHVVAYKPSGVVCHHSGWTGSRSKHISGAR